MIWIWEPDFEHFTKARFKKLFMPKERVTQPVPLKRFPRKELVQVEIEKGYPVSDFFYCGMLYIVSDGLGNVLLEQQTKIHLYPVTVTHASGKPVNENYFYVHLLCEVDCINPKESEIITTKTGTHWGKLVLDESKIHEEKLFYIKGLNDVKAMTDNLREKLIAEKFTGLDFVPYPNYLKPYYLTDTNQLD